MKNLLRGCYKEAGIIGPNAVVFENRQNIIQDIIDNDYLDNEEYIELADWLMGIKQEPEELLVRLEEKFCENDTNFSINDSRFSGGENKEINILCGVMIYEYCVSDEEQYELPLRIICGINIKHRISSVIMENKFIELVAQKRIELRKENDFAKLQSMTGCEKIRKAMQEAESNEEEYTLIGDDIKSVLKEIESCEKNIRTMNKNQDIYNHNMNAKNEEMDVLWWMISEWSETYEELYKNLKSSEAAVTIPFELYNQLQFELYPYATEQIIYKLLATTSADPTNEISLDDVITGIRKDKIESICAEFQDDEIDAKVQPVLYAILTNLKVENQDEWRMMFKAQYGNNAAEITMTARDYAIQLCRELDLFMNM